MAAKAGLEAITRYTATAGAPHGIRANTARVGAVLTPMGTGLPSTAAAMSKG
jgi:NAD(P)-dependent dehydrogenase (short-subunit alcohol dehydrogenase family)